MKKMFTVFVVAAFVLAAVVMYFYWQGESDMVSKGVLIANEFVY